MLEWSYIAAALASAVVITVALRAAPFALKNALGNSSLLADLNAWMPAGVTVILAVYCLSGIDLEQPSRAVAEIGGVVVTVAIHQWRHNLLLSIVCGTATCVVLANRVVPALI